MNRGMRIRPFVVALTGVLGLVLTLDAQAPQSNPLPGTKLSIDELKKQMFHVSAGKRLKPPSWPGGARVAVSFSFDVDVFAYVFARDWTHFLEIQEQLLFGVTAAVNRAGTEIAIPRTTMDVAHAADLVPAAGSMDRR